MPRRARPRRRASLSASSARKSRHGAAQRLDRGFHKILVGNQPNTKHRIASAVQARQRLRRPPLHSALWVTRQARYGSEGN